MKTFRINTAPPNLADDPSPLELANFLLAQLFLRHRGAIFGRWDEARGHGLWFYCHDVLAMFDDVRIDELIYHDPVRTRFRSVVFRLGSAAAEHEGDLCGVMRLLPADPSVDPGPPRAYHVHASFEPKAGLWFRAAVVPD